MKRGGILLLVLGAITAAHVGPGQARQKDKEQPAKSMVTKEAQQAIDAGLAYLAAQQWPDGSWGTNNHKGNVGITGLAGMAFLAGGHQPGVGVHGSVLTKAVKFILEQESKTEPGFLNNPNAPVHGPMYGHGFAVLFLAEAHEKIVDRKPKEQVRVVLVRAVALMLNAQNQQGGWRYQPRPVDADITVTACQFQALQAVRHLGIPVRQESLNKAVQYILTCQDLNDGGFRYMPAGGPTGFARSAAGLEALLRAGKAKSKEVEKGLDYLRPFRPGLKKPVEAQFHYYHGHYYAAQAMWRAAGTDWQKWYPAIRDELLKHPDKQVKNNGAQCYWEDRIISPHFGTAMALLVLQVPHNHLVTLKR